MKVLFDPRVKKFLKNISKQERAKVTEYVDLFKEYGFALGQKYLKKVDNKIWELRPGKMRVFLFKYSANHIVIHAMFKKSQKITKETKQLLASRLKEYL
ncbi:MAG: hypothetical protein UX85_C0001G0149 [Candidatus Beckwithbacteria bacterium GW2011_GWB1_47_15]|uniref:Type II toxin-antitoxin system RelE/ParE family toxin n=1 Tax=Candidatus Beckwithbacteria bacterium GW2011_GWB1_47_15 TaxID=1618371 RepID=A0A0G1UW48_9BACT|nr:MAG: hypothetical protein UY43_C0001G0977 [Candidatus Beckwithbacteria bacterium GW2011_GWC1_49_16]AQS30786.1 hypothetical protein [uncultured bacterium]KKU35971.1 MAG: hypothetical protein UX50_C0001G0148 [Candidatus Beckwithbacteria bacterium GW2011_GWA1_46_30]KKU61935.1 MAG: hypothetical protein UX85_C0001G0149 [Candidatus Beckwithbacteria bacterium GW2011_GWB1_47_15]KKU72511.1 MAG: hypothetical protein UX97_C0001G0381 [Candidatus Beckwithbacteria bacterium GW2011_GWA2_47_25]KKW04322.1 M